MKEIIVKRYNCEVCGSQWSDAASAESCEKQPVRNDRGVKIGDLVRITSGDATGNLCKITGIGVREPGWAPHSAYDHSVYLVGDVIDSWGFRVLDFDSYEVLK